MRYRVTSLAKGVQEGLSPPDANAAGHIRPLFVTPSTDFQRLCFGL
jgi:hypothetical protein